MSKNSHSSGTRWRNFYGRRHGLTMNKSLHDYLADDLDALSPGSVAPDVNPERVPLDLSTRFSGKPVWLEVGFGSGEHLVHQAGLNPDIGIIGCEPFINGVATLLGKIRATGCSNIAVYPDDVRDLLDVLPDAAIERAFLLYPDPWPKKRHHRRRFVTEDYLRPLARVLKIGSVFRVATDIEDFVRQTLEEVPQFGFEWLGETAVDWKTPWEDWHSTRYEQKALREGRVPYYLTFRRV